MQTVCEVFVTFCFTEINGINLCAIIVFITENIKMIKSIILAAGKGTRMKSDKPKVLHEIFGKTLVGYVIDAVNNTGLADENFVIVGHQAEKVEEYINKNYKNAKTVFNNSLLTSLNQ